MSIASVILSYFLVAGGLFAGTLVAGALKVESQALAYLLMGAGAFAGGFVAARASRGETILEPAIGAGAVVLTIVGAAAATPLGKLLWASSDTGTMQVIAILGGISITGAIAGAFVSEKMFGEATTS